MRRLARRFQPDRTTLGGVPAGAHPVREQRIHDRVPARSFSILDELADVEQGADRMLHASAARAAHLPLRGARVRQSALRDRHARDVHAMSGRLVVCLLCCVGLGCWSASPSQAAFPAGQAAGVVA